MINVNNYIHLFIFINIVNFVGKSKKKKEKRRMVSFKESVVQRVEELKKPTESICGFLSQLLIDRYGPSDTAPGSNHE